MAVTVTVALLANFVLQAREWSATGSPADNWDLVLIAAGLTATGVLVAAVGTGDRIALLLLGMGLASAVGAFATAGPFGAEVGTRIEAAVWWLAYGPLTVLLLLLPVGRLPTPRWRPMLFVAWAGVALPVLAGAVVALFDPSALLDRASAGPVARVAAVVAATGFFFTAVALTGGVVAVAQRVRTWPGDGAGALRLFLLVALAPVLGLVLDLLSLPGSWVLGPAVLPVVMLVAALRYRFLDIDLVIDRTVVWVSGTLALLGLFGGVLWLASYVAGPGAGAVTGPVVLATVGAAALGSPLRSTLQRALDRALYGRRDDPVGALTEVERLVDGDRTALPDEVVASAATAVAKALALPFVALTVDGDGSHTWSASHGRPSGAVVTLPLVHAGRAVGALRATGRSRRARLTDAELRTLEALGRSAAATVRAVALAGTLQRAREDLVYAREEERLRLRRDLHDGVGPAILGSRMQAVALRRRSTANTADGLDRLLTDLTDCAAELGRVVDGLRPPALDAGLAVAVGSLARRLVPRPGPELALDVVGPIPPAVEVGVYRIAAEALANSARHAAGGHCRVSLRHVDGGLALTVTDAGHADNAPAPPSGTGVGLDSIRARVAELGGTCVAGPSGTGFQVDVRLPLVSSPEARSPHPETSAQPARGLPHRSSRRGRTADS